MSDPTEYPALETTSFDLIIIGTGLPESLISAASSLSGKSVLHVDPNPFYGSHFSSLSLPHLSTFLNSNSTPKPTSVTHADFTTLSLSTNPIYTALDITSFCPQLLQDDDVARKFNVDLAGPRVLFCADNSIQLMLQCGINEYLEFKSIDGFFIGNDDGNLWNVPDSRAAIFKDKNLKLNEKKQLMKFFKLVQNHLAANPVQQDEQEEEGTVQKIPDEDLELPLVEFLAKMGLPLKIKSIILYAIAMADYDQHNVEYSQHLLKTRDGIHRLSLYQSSIGRFTNASGAFLYPLYGQGELPQAFCRRAAVKGCIYVLRMPVISLLMDKNSGTYKGVRLASGQDIFSQKLVLDPSFTISSPSDSTMELLHQKLHQLNLRDIQGKVARGICILNKSLMADKLSFLVIYPPRSLYPEQTTTIRALQLGGNFAVCPPGMFVLYLSAVCDDCTEGKKLINAALDALLNFVDSMESRSCSDVQTESTEEVKPTLLWRALYIQEQAKGQVDGISFTPLPDGSLNYDDILEATKKLFQHMYPTDEFFPETSAETNEDDEGLSLES